MPRREGDFDTKTKREGLKRSGGICECHRLAAAGVPGFSAEGCGVELRPGNVYHEHIIPLGAGGDNSLENLAVVTKTCGSLKAHSFDQTKVAKTKRQRDKAFGVRKRKGHPMMGSRDSPIKKKIGGGTEWRR